MQSPDKSECTAQQSSAQHDQSGNGLGIPASEHACLNTFTSLTKAAEEEGEMGGSV
jgi:hypothetical protein